MSITRYRKRPVEVDTIQWTGDNEATVQAFTGSQNFYALDPLDRVGSDDPAATAAVYDRLHSTWVLVHTGQHIVRGVKGEFYPIAEDVLAETYELAATPSADRAALCDRIAEALYAHDHPGHLVQLDGTGMGPAYRESADAVLVVLPAPADRATVLEEAADAMDARATAAADVSDNPAVFVAKARAHTARVWREAARELRRLAAEARDTTEAECSASTSGRCLRESQSETACDTDDGECVDGGRPAVVEPAEAADTETVHGCPPDGSGLTPCCGRTPFELPRTDRISSEAPTTCTGGAS